MIVSTARAFAFVHIPKCAGTSVRRQLSAAHDLAQHFDARANHPVLGRVHLAHLPLWALRDHFPEDFKALRACRSFAVIREPHDRFTSAVTEYVKANYRKRIGEYNADALSGIVEEIIAVLEKKPKFTDVKFCHFIRQSDFVFLDGERVVKTLYLLTALDRMMVDMARCTGLSLDASMRENETLYFRARWIERTLRKGSGFAFRVMPKSLYTQMKRIAKTLTARKRNEGHDLVLRSPRVQGFVKTFYADDIALHRALLLDQEQAKLKRPD